MAAIFIEYCKNVQFDNINELYEELATTPEENSYNSDAINGNTEDIENTEHSHGLLNTRPNMLQNEISNIESVQSTGFKFGTHIFQGDSNTPWEYQPHENKIGGNMGIFLKIFKGL